MSHQIVLSGRFFYQYKQKEHLLVGLKELYIADNEIRPKFFSDARYRVKKHKLGFYVTAPMVSQPISLIFEAIKKDKTFQIYSKVISYDCGVHIDAITESKTSVVFIEKSSMRIPVIFDFKDVTFIDNKTISVRGFIIPELSIAKKLANILDEFVVIYDRGNHNYIAKYKEIIKILNKQMRKKWKQSLF